MSRHWGWWVLAIAELLAAAALAVFLFARGSLPWVTQLLLIVAMTVGGLRLAGGLVMTRRREVGEQLLRAYEDDYVRRLR